MIVQCSSCGARYRLDETRMTSDTATLKCRKCGAGIAVSRGGPPLPGGEAPAAVSPPGDVSAAPFPAAAPAAVSPARPAGAPARTALLADEAREFRDFVEAELRAAGFEVSVTDSGEEALLVAGSHRFDLILLSVYLRRLLGTSVCQRIKADPALRSTPIILMGALLGPGGTAARERYGADDFVPTGISREELAARIGRFALRENAPPAAASPGAAAPPGISPAAEKEPAGAGPSPTEDEAEIRRLARIMISDIEIYHPEKFARAVRDGTFFEAFSEELGRGREMIDRRFGHLPDRIQLLAAGLRDSLEPYRNSGPRRRASGG